MQTKICTTCKASFELSNFHKDKNRKDGLSCWCKDCSKASQKRSNLKRIEQNREKARARYVRNAESLKAKALQWKKDNPDKVRIYGLRRRALKRSSKVEKYALSDVIASYGTTCHICGFEIDFSVSGRCGSPNWELGLHLDHVVPLSAGGSDTLANVKPAHAKCNVKKNKF